MHLTQCELCNSVASMLRKCNAIWSEFGYEASCLFPVAQEPPASPKLVRRRLDVKQIPRGSLHMMRVIGNWSATAVVNDYNTVQHNGDWSQPLKMVTPSCIPNDTKNLTPCRYDVGIGVGDLSFKWRLWLSQVFFLIVSCLLLHP